MVYVYVCVCVYFFSFFQLIVWVISVSLRDVCTYGKGDRRRELGLLEKESISMGLSYIWSYLGSGYNDHKGPLRMALRTFIPAGKRKWDPWALPRRTFDPHSRANRELRSICWFLDPLVWLLSRGGAFSHRPSNHGGSCILDPRKMGAMEDGSHGRWRGAAAVGGSLNQAL